MSKNGPRAYQGNGIQATTAKYRPNFGVMRAGPEYGNLVSRLCDEYNLTAAESKARIARKGRHTVLLEVNDESV